MRRPLCGDCVDCIDATRRLTRPVRAVAALPGPRPTRKQLERHGARYGWAQVAETAEELGIPITVPAGAEQYPGYRWRRRRRR